MTTSITIEGLKEKVFESIFSQCLHFDYSEHSRETVHESFEDFSISCTYEVDYKYRPASYDFPAEETILKAWISNLEIDFYDDEMECNVEEVEDFVNLELAELW